MFLIDYVAPEKAKGTVKDIYAMFPENIGVPESIQIFSANPVLLERQAESIKYFMGQEALSYPLLAAIRFVAAKDFGHPYCTELNKKMLLAAGLSEEEVNKLGDDPSIGFDENEAALLTFVLKSIKEPDATNQKDIDALRNLGWSDTSIFDAMAQATQMAAAGVLYRTFKK